MIKKILIVPVVLMVLTMIGCSNDDTTTRGLTRSLGTMNGVVITIIDESPIPGATLEIYSLPIDTFPLADTVGGKITMTGLTGDNGRYTVSVPVGRIWVRANAPGFKRSPPQSWSLAPNATGELNFVLYPGEGDFPFDPPEGWDVVSEYPRKAFDPCFPGFERSGPHDERFCGEP